MASKLLIRTGNSLINRLRLNSTPQNNRIWNPQTLSPGHGAEVTPMLFPSVSKHQTAHNLQPNDTESLRKLESEGIFFPFGLPSLRFFLPDDGMLDQIKSWAKGFERKVYGDRSQLKYRNNAMIAPRVYVLNIYVSGCEACGADAGSIID